MEKPNGRRLIRIRSRRKTTRAYRTLARREFFFQQVMRKLRMKTRQRCRTTRQKVGQNQFQANVKNNLLYNTVIESDGLVHREETFGGPRSPRSPLSP